MCEGCSKSHFSHIRNEVEKVTPRPLILERFLEPKSTQDRKKGHSKSLQKSSRILMRFLIDFCSILDPTGSPKIKHFSLIFTLGATLGPSWRPKCSKTAPELDFPKNFVPFWGQFSKGFVRFRSLFFIQFLA